MDCTVVEKGNPADSTLAPSMIDRQIEIYGRSPDAAAFDGGCATERAGRVPAGSADVNESRGFPDGNSLVDVAGRVGLSPEVAMRG